MNYCPNCGHRVYQHGKNGCEHVETVGHIIRFMPDGWMLKHPRAEQDNDEILSCPVRMLLPPALSTPVPTSGEYALIDINGQITFGPPDSARAQCDCQTTIIKFRDFI